MTSIKKGKVNPDTGSEDEDSDGTNDDDEGDKRERLRVSQTFSSEQRRFAVVAYRIAKRD
ncbi:hypothetical protein E4U16_008012 [Claviceps sp. LM84 group G4]|nr:hypothetical protein E4U16_008012 [Claviceps sp. LM84 group G4]